MHCNVDDTSDLELADHHVVPNLCRLYTNYIKQSNNSCYSSSTQNVHKTDPLQNRHFWPTVSTPETTSVSDPIINRGVELNTSQIFPKETDADELDHLLYRFDVFFREKVNTELQSLQDFMSDMLIEQQIHLRRMLHSRLHPDPSSTSTINPVLNHGLIPEYTAYPTSPLGSNFEETEMQFAMGQPEGYQQQPMKNELFLELMSLALEVSSVLCQSKYCS